MRVAHRERDREVMKKVPRPRKIHLPAVKMKGTFPKLTPLKKSKKT